MAKNLQLKKRAQKWIKRLLNDPIVKTLLKNSNLTKTQLETFLIDVLVENFSEKPLNYDEKARLRLTRPPVTRGAFNRTLKQAKRNIIQSVYTIILLGYIGVFEGSFLTPYIEVANKLRTYVTAYRDALEGRKDSDECIKMMNMLRGEIESTLKELSEP